MYGLTHRFATDSLADVTPIGASATVLVIDRDPLTLDLARRAIADHYRIIVAENGTDALSMIDEHHPDVVMIDMTLKTAEIAMVTVALAACDELDSTPVLMVDPDQPTNAVSLRRRIDEAIRVTRRVYLGGGLRHRVAA
ncbi:MAG TPA: response regulator [Gaiellales bacterium]|jgi:response regulator RpfG family c-di-GMP phosphodiesterase